MSKDNLRHKTIETFVCGTKTPSPYTLHCRICEKDCPQCAKERAEIERLAKEKR